MFEYYECVKCGKKYYPPKIRCRCGSTEFKKKTLDVAMGEIITYTTIFVPPKGFKPPIKMALVSVDGMMILGKYDGREEPYIGKKVKVDLIEGKAVLTDP